MSDEPENFTLTLLRKIDAKVDGLAGEVADMRKVMATKCNVADVRSELRSVIHSLRADVASDIMNLEKNIKELEKRLSDQISGLRARCLTLPRVTSYAANPYQAQSSAKRPPMPRAAPVMITTGSMFVPTAFALLTAVPSYGEQTTLVSSAKKRDSVGLGDFL